MPEPADIEAFRRSGHLMVPGQPLAAEEFPLVIA